MGCPFPFTDKKWEELNEKWKQDLASKLRSLNTDPDPLNKEKPTPADLSNHGCESTLC